MKVKISELTGTALDWAIAKSEGLNIPNIDSLKCKDDSYWVMTRKGIKHYTEIPSGSMNRQYVEIPYSPSTKWSQGGPIITKMILDGVVLSRDNNGWPVCRTWSDNVNYYGETPLIAAMRCYVASKLGDEVDIPEELNG